jgi:hypothetical protein
MLYQRGQLVDADSRRSRLVEQADLQRALILVGEPAAKGGPDAAPLVARNDPDLVGPIFARDLGQTANVRTMALFPDRAVFRLVDDRLVPVAR